MKSTLIFRVFKGEQIVVVKQFQDTDQVVIGSDSEGGVQVVLEAPEVSPIHCLVEKRDSGYYICDLGSEGGTFKNGQQILDEPIETADEVTVGPFRIVFFIGVPKPVHTPKGSEIVIPPPASVKPGSINAPAPNTKAAVTATHTADETYEKPTTQPVEKPIERVAEKPAEKPVDKQKEKSKQNRNAGASAGVSGLATPTKSINPVTGKPEIRRETRSYKTPHSKYFDYYAPESEVKDLRDFIRPTKGPVLEVIVSWKERILQTYHFRNKAQIFLGDKQDVSIPQAMTTAKFLLVDLSAGVRVNVAREMIPELIRSDVRLSKRELEESGRLSFTGGEIASVKLEQNEVLVLAFDSGVEIYIRFAPEAPVQPYAPVIFSSTEAISVIAAVIISLLTSFYVSVTAPKNEEVQEDVQRVAQVIFDNMKVQPPPPPPPTPVEPTPPPPVTPPPPPPPPPEVKKIVAEDKKQEQKNKGDKKLPDQRAQQAKNIGRAEEVRATNPNNSKKMFTSSKQGGAIKTGDKSGANAQSAEKDPTNQGLLAAFGVGGSRSKLDKAYNGSGELLGMAGNATGSSGFNESRPGADLGSKFKDTGAGGKGTATQGIAGIGTKGRGSGMAEYGGDTGLNNKTSVAVQPGGVEEEFIGTIDKEAVRRVVRSALAAFKGCYERELKRDSKLEGKVVIAWEIREKGVAANARVVSDKSTINNRVVEECVKTRMLTLRFPEPPPGTVAEVQYPFFFTSQK